MHRLARERIEGAAAYEEIRRDLQEWAPVVKKNRLAEQLVFPLESDPPMEQSISEKLLFFKV
ncbi:unnamed protein product [Gongylonema pulchrum]|uniref:Acyl-CoA dehydrogenase n=1 Tax=Gongylonema pulchrum TaxID=637853 RepID=A0A183DMF8_9BILA|nr:unnamed protein product [Gongylonema pulchrum]